MRMGEESHRMLQAQTNKGSLAGNSPKIALEIMLTIKYEHVILWTAAAQLPLFHFRVRASPDSLTPTLDRLSPPLARIREKCVDHKSFRCNIYEKQGEGPLAIFTWNTVADDALRTLSERSSHVSGE